MLPSARSVFYSSKVSGQPYRQCSKLVSSKATMDPFKSGSSTAVTVTENGKISDPNVHKWLWKNHTITYRTAGCGKPVILIHGFGASSAHFRKNIPELAKTNKVYALDLLGFGESDMPALEYSMELWAEQIEAFIDEFVDQPVVLVGNSIGSLASLMVGVSRPDTTRGIVLLNTAGAMNNKGVINDWRIVLALPLLLLIDILLRIKPIAAALFNNIRSREAIRAALTKLYSNQLVVDDELVESFYTPACREGALDVFISVITGPAGPKPFDLIPRLSCPLLVLWGDADTLTPVDGPVGKYMVELATTRPKTIFKLLPGTGHCLHDDRADLVHAELLPWLQELTVPQN